MARLNFAGNIAVVDGPTVAKAAYLTVEGYDRMDVVVPHGGAAKTVDLANAEAGAIKALIMQTDIATDKLTFTTDEVVTEKKLDGLIMLIGAGSVANLGSPLNTITFENAETTNDVTVTLLIGRTVIEAPVG